MPNADLTITAELSARTLNTPNSVNQPAYFTQLHAYLTQNPDGRYSVDYIDYEDSIDHLNLDDLDAEKVNPYKYDGIFGHTVMLADSANREELKKKVIEQVTKLVNSSDYNEPSYLQKRTIDGMTKGFKQYCEAHPMDVQENVKKVMELLGPDFNSDGEWKSKDTYKCPVYLITCRSKKANGCEFGGIYKDRGFFDGVVLVSNES